MMTGYARVSTGEQNLRMQVRELEACGWALKVRPSF